MALNKKRSLYANDTDGRALDALSKAALIDIVVEYVRRDVHGVTQQHDNTPVTIDELAQHVRIQSILQERGDRLLQSTEQIAAKAAKTAKQDALFCARNERLKAELEHIRAERAKAQRERICAQNGMHPLSVMVDELSAKAEADKKAAAQRARNEAATKKLLAAHHKRVQDAAIAAGADAALADIRAERAAAREKMNAITSAVAYTLGNKR